MLRTAALVLLASIVTSCSSGSSTSSAPPPANGTDWMVGTWEGVEHDGFGGRSRTVTMRADAMTDTEVRGVLAIDGTAWPFTASPPQQMAGDPSRWLFIIPDGPGLRRRVGTVVRGSTDRFEYEVSGDRLFGVIDRTGGILH